MNTKLEVSKDLEKIIIRLTQTNNKNFTEKLNNWYKIYKLFLGEKQYHQ
jgi:hypothetical protein